MSVKVQDLLSEYLYRNKTLTLPSIGRFELNDSINVYEGKQEELPADAITFHQDDHAVLDDNLLEYLVQHSGKMKPLALSDLDSYISSGLQFLNIGKPFTIRGIGSITKTHRQLFFQQGPSFVEKGDQGTKYILKDRTRQTEEIKELSFDSKAKKGTNKKLMIGVLSLIGLCLIVLAVYLALPKKEEKTTLPEPVSEVQDSVTETTIKDTLVNTIKDTAALPLKTETSGSFQLFLSSYKDSISAGKRLEALKLRGFNVKLVPAGEKVHVILTVQRPLADTSYVLDSLRRNYLWNPRLIQQ